MEQFQHPPLTPRPGDVALAEILRHVSVPRDVLDEAQRRRNLVCKLALLHPAARGIWYAGSIAHGTHNSPLGDADCGVMVDRRPPEFRMYGPDAEQKLGPEMFIRAFAEAILPAVRAAGYPNATLDLTGNRTIKIEFHQPVDIGEFGPVDPYVDLIVGLERRDGPGIWIPNRKRQGWDPAHPQKHTELMTQRDSEELIVQRAHLIRLGKRAIKRDGLDPRTPAMCSWNYSVMGLESVTERAPLADGLGALMAYASSSIAAGLTNDPADVAGPIALPDGMTRGESSTRLAWMGSVVAQAAAAENLGEARRTLSPLFGVEIDEIREREQRLVTQHPLNSALRGNKRTALTGALGVSELKRTRSDGERR